MGMSMQGLWRGAAAVALVCGPAVAAEPWPGQPLTAAQRSACQPLPRALVRAVELRHRAEATALLQAAPAAMLSDAQAAQWIGVDEPPRGALADRLLKDATDAMLERRETAIGEHALKWSASEQVTLEVLRREVGQAHAPLKPVLVRALAGPEEAGVFDAAACGDGLAVRYTERGDAKPAPVPVIVFVEQPPIQVQAWRETGGP
jgi:hypothetical protein